MVKGPAAAGGLDQQHGRIRDAITIEVAAYRLAKNLDHCLRRSTGGSLDRGLPSIQG